MGRPLSPCTYILASQPRGTLYIGVTSDIERRLSEHRLGDMPGFTARYGVKRLVWLEYAGDMDAAIAREKQLKRWRRAWKVNLIEAGNPEWHDLGEDLGFPPLT